MNAFFFLDPMPTTLYYNASLVCEGMSTPEAPIPRLPVYTGDTIPDGDFLLFLGKRVRQIRNLRGMTRKMVARESTCLNVILRSSRQAKETSLSCCLRRIAAALNVSLVELFALR